SVGLAQSLDQDLDDWLAPEELARLQAAAPQVELAVVFRETPDDGQPAASIELVSHTAEATPLAAAGSSRLLLKVGGTGLVVAAYDRAASEPARDRSGRTRSPIDRRQVRLMVHDQFDGLFQRLDADLDGCLSARETAYSSERLLLADANGDGQIGGDELPYVLTASFLRGEPAAERSFYNPPLQQDAVGGDSAPPSWFRNADFNGDGDISQREFLASPEQFGLLDANRDGFIEPDEAVRPN
ncbi:MAG: hypothetical protein IT424_00830, partial [Pirellulales bacterium]|nr:hypothetical protein [Pirellulales bacterium]